MRVKGPGSDSGAFFSPQLIVDLKVEGGLAKTDHRAGGGRWGEGLFCLGFLATFLTRQIGGKEKSK